MSSADKDSEPEDTDPETDKENMNILINKTIIPIYSHIKTIKISF